MALPGLSFEVVQSAGPVLGLRADRTAMIAVTERGPLETPVLVHSHDEFVQKLGHPLQGMLGSLLAESYFKNGGEELVVARFLPSEAKRATATLPLIGPSVSGKPIRRMELLARDPGEWGNDVVVDVLLHVRKRARGARVPGVGNEEKVRVGPVSAKTRLATSDLDLPIRLPGQLDADGKEYWSLLKHVDAPDSGQMQTLTFKENVPAAPVGDNGVILVEVYERAFGLLIQERGRPDILVDGLDVKKLDELHKALASTPIEATVDLTSLPGEEIVPLPVSGQSIRLRNGSLDLDEDGDQASLRQSFERALAALELSELPDIVAAPDLWNAIFRTKGISRLAFDAQNAIELGDAMVRSAARTADRVVILDPPLVERDQGPRPMTASELVAWHDARATSLVGNERDFAATYTPWVRVVTGDIYRGDDTMLVPPSLFVAGRMAETTRNRGPWNATGNVSLENAVGLDTNLVVSEQEELLDVGINPITMELPQGATIQGVRSLACPDRGAWRFLSTRRLLNYVRRAIRPIGLSYVFEPNTVATWIQIRRDLERFLSDLFRAGALAGSLPQQAFFVKVDEDLNTEYHRDAGILMAQIGLAPAYPLEFLVVRLSVAKGAMTVTEEPVSP